MKYVLPLLLYTTISHASAPSKCAVVEMRGEVKRIEHKLIIVTAPKSLSQKILNIDYPARRDFLPYIGQVVKGEFIVKDADPEMQILKVEKIEETISDPLTNTPLDILKKKKDVACPSSL